MTVEVDGTTESLWVEADAVLVLQALEYLVRRLVDELAVTEVRLSAAQGDAGTVFLDVSWSGTPISSETAIGWETEPMANLQRPSPLSVRDVLMRHRAQMGFERHRATQRACLRWRMAGARVQAMVHVSPSTPDSGRPEFYDFDLFAQRPTDGPLLQHPLDGLTYTVIDTETTGLRPSEGDEIIQMGAVRIVNGRLLAHECFDQLVDPGRSIPAQTVPIHGITTQRVQGQPRIGAVLPQFHRFAAQTVLVAHNSAFDMRFLQIQQRQLGLRFDQPVLDTLLLSAFLHPHQASHRLEAIAERLGVRVQHRHNALGDALVTAEVFLRLLPLLHARGIRTLGQALEASRSTQYARLAY